MDYPYPTTIDCSCAERPDPDALMHAAIGDDHLFRTGAYVDDDGRQIVTNLIRRGHSRTTAMRVAIRLELERP